MQRLGNCETVFWLGTTHPLLHNCAGLYVVAIQVIVGKTHPLLHNFAGLDTLGREPVSGQSAST